MGTDINIHDLKEYKISHIVFDDLKTCFNFEMNSVNTPPLIGKVKLGNNNTRPASMVECLFTNYAITRNAAYILETELSDLATFVYMEVKRDITND